MSTLYITQQDSVLRKVDERLQVTHQKETLLDIPMIKVSQVVLFGRVMVTAATVATLMEHGIGLCHLSEHGRYISRLEPEFSKNSLLRVDQYRAASMKAENLGSRSGSSWASSPICVFCCFVQIGSRRTVNWPEPSTG